MGDDKLGEEMAARENDRNGNAPLRRGPDPDRVAMHLATGEGETLIEKKAVDGFKTESPIRAFTDFQVSGGYAIGKGFRPSVAHLARYLDAMSVKEGWRLVQVILPRDNDGDPTLLFERTAGLPFRPGVHGGGHEVKAVKLDDAVNPKHYDGRACADIGERLSANGYQVLKYCWRLGRKDDPCQELGKALWYLDSEATLIHTLPEGHMVYPNVWGLDEPDAFMEERIADQPLFTQNIARMLWAGYNGKRLQIIRNEIDEHRFHLDCGRGLAI